MTYAKLLEELKGRIQAAQSRAALAVNAELVRLYWEIGRTILQRQEAEGWGAKVVDRLAQDLKDAFPAMKGFSSRKLKYMRTFAERCPHFQIGQQPAAQLPWFHLVTLLTQVEGEAERTWLASQAGHHELRSTSACRPSRTGPGIPEGSLPVRLPWPRVGSSLVPKRVDHVQARGFERGQEPRHHPHQTAEPDPQRHGPGLHHRRRGRRHPEPP